MPNARLNQIINFWVLFFYNSECPQAWLGFSEALESILIDPYKGHASPMQQLESKIFSASTHLIMNM